MGNDEPFSGKIIIFLGNFRQTCPVIQGGSCQQVVNASIRSSPLWDIFNIKQLTVCIRNAMDPEFTEYVDAIGDGAGPEVEIPYLQNVFTEEDLINFVFPQHVLQQASQCLKHSILCPTNMQVNVYNSKLLHCINGVQRTYHAADSLKEADDVGLPSPNSILDYVVMNTPPRMPHHALTIKVNSVCHLIRNISVDEGLVKNTHVIIVDVGHRIVTVRIL